MTTVVAHHGEELPEEVEQWKEYLPLPVALGVRDFPSQHLQHVGHGRPQQPRATGRHVPKTDVRERVCSYGRQHHRNVKSDSQKCKTSIFLSFSCPSIIPDHNKLYILIGAHLPPQTTPTSSLHATPTISVRAELALLWGQGPEESSPMVGVALVHQPGDENKLLLLLLRQGGGVSGEVGSEAEGRRGRAHGGGFVDGGVDGTVNDLFCLSHRERGDHLTQHNRA